MRETILLQILDPFTELFEVGHTSRAHGSHARSSRALTPAKAWCDTNGNGDVRFHALGGRLAACTCACNAASRGGRTTVTVHGASAATLAETLPSSERANECCRAPITI